MRILIMGGTRFIGVALTKILVEQGHEVTLFNRGNKPSPVKGVKEIYGDRKETDQLKEKLATESFDAVFDNNGRELSDTQPLVELFKDQVEHFAYVSSAGVYLKSDQMPHYEADAIDPKSRHKGKHDTENYLSEMGLPWTSVRPVYIYGAGNYNDLEAWFFDRIVRDRAIPIPGHGEHITQLGHVQDLAYAMASILGNKKALAQVYNISGERYVTFNGIARACAKAAGKSPDDLKLVHYNPGDFDFGKKKPFPLRMQHFFADISKAKMDLGWQPQYDLISGLKESFEKDYLASNRHEVDIDFSIDEEILGVKS